MEESKMETYAAAGVQIEEAEQFVERLVKKARRQGHSNLWSGAGAYATVSPLNADLAVAATTDGVGTKLLVANELQTYNSIGIDLVAMCANDLICVGATPTVFLDYMAVGKIEEALVDGLIEGIIEGCDRAAMLLAGGETAEMPGVYAPGHYDLAGFALGTVTRESLLSGNLIEPGQKVIAVASTGVHSNGLSLARKVLADDRKNFAALLEPTAIYVKPAMQALSRWPGKLVGLAHITGGGWRNILRLNKSVGYRFSDLPPMPAVLEAISQKVSTEEMFKTFNMGMGLALIAKDEAVSDLVKIFAEHGHKAWVLGEVTENAGEVHIDKFKLVLKSK